MLPYTTRDNAKQIAKETLSENNIVSVVANPGGVLTDSLSSIGIGGVSYGISAGSSSSSIEIFNAVQVEEGILSGVNYADVDAAYEAGKVVYLKITSSDTATDGDNQELISLAGSKMNFEGDFYFTFVFVEGKSSSPVIATFDLFEDNTWDADDRYLSTVEVPNLPQSAGTYKLQAIEAMGTMSYTWIQG